MKKITIISKQSCAPCQALKEMLKTLPENINENIDVIDDTNTEIKDIYNMMDFYGSYSFPTIILHDQKRIVNGFGAGTKKLILDYFEYVEN